MRWRTSLHAALALCACAIFSSQVTAASPDDRAWEFAHNGRKVAGRLLASQGDQAYLLGVDGRLWTLDASETAALRSTAAFFRPAQPSLLRGMLLGELGSGYEVTGAGRFMIAHPSGQRDVWADRFDAFYRSFVHYFSVRGVKLQEPPCLLPGVVCRNRDDFTRKTQREGLGTAAGIVGWYNFESNRLMIYDMQGKGATDRWQANATVLLHEATHQLAFNTGLHNRCVPPPVWLAEGLATLFEAPGVYDARNHPQLRDRLNTDQLRAFQRLVRPQCSVASLKAMVASDSLFRTAPAPAYAQAWALTLYLTESAPRQYGAYLAKTAARSPFAVATPAERLADFTAVFGGDWAMLHAHFLRFMDAAR